ncbi:hypothetical protein GCM10011369_13570 [Neiella marina]|uniref:DUF4437 domain-containing protein n=1 Tax=Neiella marina TaxID=508461 RepID=A0A8J2U446_9GAMM|nr:DUF4437 domain-containing protein [Neiella marina]GGA73133.1 hypothetical protein GCM10011369_13570 [Neiella marina]
MKRLVCLSSLPLLSLLLSSVALATNGEVKVVAASDIKWGYLNPLRGKLSPGAADLWGDRTIDTATGMLVRFNRGFESPPHIHNITYRGIVIDGLLHNDDPTAAKMWMPAGSFWTQPAGEDHTTAANAETNLIYLEIDSGPYLVQPSQQSFDNGERPLNVHKDNIVWLNHSELHDINASGVDFTYVWQTASDISGSMIKLPPNFDGAIRTEASEFRAVVIAGELAHSTDNDKSTRLTAGSYIESDGGFTHKLTNRGDSEAIVYIRSNGRYSVD